MRIKRRKNQTRTIKKKRREGIEVEEMR